MPQVQSQAASPVGAGRIVKALVVSVAALCLAAPGFARSQVFEHNYPLPSGGSFTLENVNGSVQVDGWEKEEVEVRAVKVAQNDPQDLERVEIDVQSCPAHLLVRTKYPKGEGVAVSVDYHIHVPYRVLLGSVETVNGSVLVRGIEGTGALRSVNGNVEVLNSSGRFSARTTNGNLRLELRRLTDGGPMAIETVNGSVALGLPANARADLKILSMNGEFSSELPVASQGSLTTRSFHGRIGSGGGEVSVRTINGGIRLFLEPPGI
jgi:hypothetical protein